LEALDRAGDLLLDAGGTHWHSLRRQPHREVNLRSAGEGYRIVDGAGKSIGTVDGHRVHRECHEGAVYLHQGQTYEVRELSPKDRQVVVEAVSVDYYTEVRSEKETEILEVEAIRAVGPSTLLLGRVRVTERVLSYLRRRIFGGEAMGEIPLEAPPLTFETQGFWVAMPHGLPDLLASRGLHVMGGIHAFEHALIGIFPLSALADRWDLGGISCPLHPQVGGPAVFVYDGYPGGVGLSAKGFERFEVLLADTSRLIRDCPCEIGCPGCIQSPKCGNGNRPLDKEAALLLTDVLDGRVGVGTSAAVAEVPRVARPEPPSRPEPPGCLVLDVETQRLAAEVGGWGHIREMRLAIAVTWDLDRDRWRTYFEEEARDLVEELLAARMVVGFNVKRFDLEVLRPYAGRGLGAVKALDLLEVVRSRLGFRVSLESLAESNFGEGKSADGLAAVRYFREGRFDLLESYCRKDVELTGRLYRKGVEEGSILFRDRGGHLLRINVRGWEEGGK
jgi:DEAD/DEAH box helicase domain-containing protein